MAGPFRSVTPALAGKRCQVGRGFPATILSDPENLLDAKLAQSID